VTKLTPPAGGGASRPSPFVAAAEVVVLGLEIEIEFASQPASARLKPKLKAGAAIFLRFFNDRSTQFTFSVRCLKFLNSLKKVWN
jgi:hypothetical protein